MKRKTSGFTLVELMVVMTIIAVLMIMGVTNYIQQQKKARDARRVSDLEQVKAALEMYRVDKGSYPYCHPEPNPDGSCPVGNTLLIDPANGVDNFIKLEEILMSSTPEYITRDFSDPSNGSYHYVYRASDPGINYVLCAYLETDTNDTCPESFPVPYDTGYGFYSP